MKRSSPKSRRQNLPALLRLSGCAAVLSLVVGASGCTSGSSSSSTDHAADGPQSAQVKTACERAAAGTAEVQFKAPGGPVDGTALKGKSIYIIPIINTGTVSEYTKQMEEAAGLLGASVVTIDAKGSIPNAVSAFNQAIARGADVIVNVAVQPELVKAQMLNAQSQGIKVIDVMNGQPDSEKPEGVDGRVSWDTMKAGKWRMDQAICDTNGTLKAGFISSDDLPMTKFLRAGMQAEYDELCTDDCSLVTTNVSSSNWATGLAQATTSLVQKNPDLNYLLPAWGGMVVQILPTMTRIDPGNKIQLSSNDLEPALLKPLAAGDNKADVGTSVGALAWPTLDQALRLVSGQKAVIEEGPARMVTSEMAESMGLSSDKSTLDNQTLIFGDLVTGDGYKALWGLTDS
ncbi:substrate-binding domain-containing protein [Rhodococcus sp. ACS1]|uniref:sugar ABC transporter substrate-binding protein n=1 Tax=Rhodococcus sp. ACS1 TaxID=2028570 RepID=UPI0015C7B3E5|nr:substrate-binding domain-containing protein [Rhodococcus sp. ACS1]